MVATVSTPATLSSVKSVFGGATTLYNYRRGGTYVKNFNAYSGIGTGPVTLSSFAGRKNPVVEVSGITVYDSAVTGSVLARVEFFSNGIYKLTGLTTSHQQWLFDGNASDYEIFLHKTGGDTPTGSAVNTWIAMGSTVSWQISGTAPPVTVKSTDANFSIRHISPQIAIQSNTSFSLDIESGT